MNRKYQIFISSTYTDLIDERKYVQDVILSMNHFPVGMELFSAASTPHGPDFLAHVLPPSAPHLDLGS